MALLRLYSDLLRTFLAGVTVEVGRVGSGSGISDTLEYFCQMRNPLISHLAEILVYFAGILTLFCGYIVLFCDLYSALLRTYLAGVTMEVGHVGGKSGISETSVSFVGTLVCFADIYGSFSGYLTLFCAYTWLV